MRTRPLAALTLILAGCGHPLDTSWHDETGYRWRALDVPHRGTPGFTLLGSSKTGVAFQNTVSESLLVHNRILAQGAGVCLGDVDGDGRADIYLARTEGANALYRNLGGWRFEDITARAGIGIAAADRYSTGCTLTDVDGDGDLDLILVALGGPNTLFLN
ncbi:MAG TPA: FG-GAP-like repeat-containing protein, partial [Gemmatimonadales bacterium]